MEKRNSILLLCMVLNSYVYFRKMSKNYEKEIEKDL